MSGRLSGKRAMILGVALQNVGAAIARTYIDHGAQVVIAGRRTEPLQQIADEIGAEWVACDITDEASLNKAVEDAADKMGGLDIGVNSTGWGLLKPFLETSRDELERMAAVQFTGPFQFFQALVRNMQHGGSIIQISSVTATIMFEDHAAYMGTKAGIDHVIRTIANEFGDRGIRANSIAAGGVADAPMSGGGMAIPAMRELYMREIPLRRPGMSADIANAALWLASEESSFVTGQVIHVSGGQTLRRNPSIAEVYAIFGAEQ
ncbi:SDR family oxidoreductase [Sphingomonadales bacterium 56]|jgi:NAD(P)-dependent dehydrogenase (short-subunit alcohol dehydrogenase family)|uniref:SDR family oxidoreductase n=1 Tax=unclassified Sphingobium TaxID=2611147 RepID=UPI001918AF29|nr:MULTISPECIES: SDR family oxidoreductase [unclassified Sphingobium]MBY2930284.1 SDR family oxidoreductase [Sphingomonadales bacterium 56]MBY2960328.1 SDR family oxidoreductase [Sphingomonadales bacterium 58]CAD7340888.1 Glucose 1-dehydrogenase [Sphingobium sp. S8]CAD7341059.1 Glucose 1-dehydrogenase [Sphingobium sp. S6]